ncbi:MAG: hypothetical protein M0Q15_10675 [Nevskia sp.]|jgi:hypothetical protein|nr:hypothetical protein [Nevskia sp.]
MSDRPIQLPIKRWRGSAGDYATRLEGVANGEQMLTLLSVDITVITGDKRFIEVNATTPISE